MKIIFLVFFAFITVPSFGQNTSVYKDSEYFFSISYPKNWKPEEQKSHPSVRLEVISENGTGTANFNIVVKNVKGSEKVSSASYVKLFLDNPTALKQLATQNLPDAKIISSGKTFLSNKDAFYLIFEGGYKTLDQTILLKVYQLQVFFEGNIYTLTFGCEKAEFEAYFPTFKAIASSFGIIPTKAIVTPSKKTEK